MAFGLIGLFFTVSARTKSFRGCIYIVVDKDMEFFIWFGYFLIGFGVGVRDLFSVKTTCDLSMK